MNGNLWLRITCMVAALAFIFAGCDKRPKSQAAEFTRADSLTETYLSLQDSMLSAWNTMIHDDNRKITAMHQLIAELASTHPEKRDELQRYEERLDDLARLRYDQQSMSNTEIVSEYDFASNSLVSELISLAESQTDFVYNSRSQQLVDAIRAADQRVNNYRAEYDLIAKRFNTFIEHNRELLEDIHKDSMKQKPLFQMATE